MPAFLYPKSKHIRRQSPPKWKTYRRYKPILRQEFEEKCVYCRLPDTLKGQDNYGVDHYKPKKDFHNLIAEYSNLFYACNCCNRRKGTFWPKSDDMTAGRFIPNPCDHIMFDHLRYIGVKVVHHSETGNFAKDLLDLNDEESVEYRQMVIDIINSLKEKQQKIEETYNKLENLIQSCTTSTEEQNLKKKKKETENALNRIKDYYKKLSGQ